MTTPALIPAAMITLVAFAAAADRRHAAMAAWYGVALAFSPVALLAAPYFIGVAIARRLGVRAAAALTLPALGTALALRALGLPRAESIGLPTWPVVPLSVPAALFAAVLVAIVGTFLVRRRRRHLA